MEKITFVTAFYKLRIKENDQYNICASVDRYLKAAERFYNKDINLVVFIEPDEELRNHVKKHREGKEHKTLVIERPYEELKLWPKLNRFIETDKNYHIPNLDFKKFTPLYYLIINNKVEFVNEAIDINPFNTPRFSWIDFRSFELSPITDENFNKIGDLVANDRIHINMMCYTSKNEIKNKYEYYRFFRGNVAATFWIGGKNELKYFIEKCRHELEWCLNNGFAVTEEMIYGYVLGTNPELFYPYIGDYGESLINFEGIHKNIWLAFRSLDKAINDCNWEYVKFISEIIIKSHNMNFTPIDNNALYHVYIKAFNAYNHLNDNNNLIIKLEDWLNKANNNIELTEKIRSNKSNILELLKKTSELNKELYCKLEQI
jgi:hypothetical protein